MISIFALFLHLNSSYCVYVRTIIHQSQFLSSVNLLGNKPGSEVKHVLLKSVKHVSLFLPRAPR